MAVSGIAVICCFVVDYGAFCTAVETVGLCVKLKLEIPSISLVSSLCVKLTTISYDEAEHAPILISLRNTNFSSGYLVDIACALVLVYFV